MATITATTLAGFRIQRSNSIVAGVDTPSNIDLPQGWAPTTWTHGTGANQVNLDYTEYTTLSSTSVTRDLTALAAAATNTGAAAFTAIKGVLIVNSSASTGNLVVGNAATVAAPFAGVGGGTDTISIPPGGSHYWINPSAAGSVVTTNKNLKLNCAAAVATFSLTIIGLS